MFICEDCGRLREDVGCYYEAHGELRANECDCGGVFVEAKECPSCGEYINPHGAGLCDNCLENEMTVENAIELGEYNRESVKLNGFYLSIMTLEQIEYIIKDWVSRTVLDKSAQVKEYIGEDLWSLFYFKARKKNEARNYY